MPRIAPRVITVLLGSSLALLGAACRHTDPAPDLAEDAGATEIIPLYGTALPDALPVSPGSAAEQQARKAGVPTLTLYVPAPENATGTAVVVCPGGGYASLATDVEGHQVARYLVGQGITAAVLRYRLPNPLLQTAPSMAPLLDAQQALRLMRRKAGRWRLRPDRVGLLGFSAGGHLTALAGTLPKSDSLSPNFLALVYPVVSMADSLTHLGSRERLLGPQPTAEQIRLFSCDYLVTDDTPPTFLVHAADDHIVTVKNSRAFYRACRRNGVPAELRVYPSGGHSFGLNVPGAVDPWPERLLVWLRGRSLLN